MSAAENADERPAETALDAFMGPSTQPGRSPMTANDSARLLAAVVELRDRYRASAALHDQMGAGDEPFKHAAWANRADDLDRILAPFVAIPEAGDVALPCNPETCRPVHTCGAASDGIERVGERGEKP